jgi:hypothetical protein
MSNPHSHAKVPGGGGPDNLHDMNLGKIVIVGVVSLTVFALGIVWAYRIWVGHTAEVQAAGGVASEPTQFGKEEIGIVDQVPFDTDQRIDKLRAHNKKALSSYGWVDRAKGIARIPIEQAMERVVANPPDIAQEGVTPAVRPSVSPAGPGPAEKGKAMPRNPRDRKAAPDTKAGEDTKDTKGGTAQ